MLYPSKQAVWQALEGAGMASKMLRCIQSIYNINTARVHTQSGLTDAFRCTIGAKQGCPMSPNFGLYLDDLQAALQNTPDSACPMLGDTTLPLLLYADDLATLPHSQEGLQHLMKYNLQSRTPTSKKDALFLQQATKRDHCRMSPVCLFGVNRWDG